MVTEFKFPDVGEGIDEGELVKWKVKVGDVVKEDDVLAEVETDKAVVEIPSPTSGTILKILAQEGDTIKVGQVIVVIGDKGEKVTASKAPKQEKKKDSSTSVIGSLEEADDEEEATPKQQQTTQTQTAEQTLAFPATRKLAKELGVDLSKVEATGASGRVTDQDVKKAAGKTGGIKEPLQAKASKKITVKKKYDMYGYVDRIPLKGMRKVIAKHMIESAFTATHVTHMDEADVTQLYDIRKHEKEKAKEKGIKLTFLPFVMKAMIAALKKHPLVNSSLDEDTEEIIVKKYYNIGIGVDTPDGLMVFVIKRAETKSILDMAKEIENLAEKARNRKIDVLDLKGSTITITNYGSVGGLYGTPIINYPDVAILGIGKIVERPRVVNGEIKVRRVMGLSVSFDHRVVDGAEIAAFTNDMKIYLEDPDSLLLEN